MRLKKKMRQLKYLVPWAVVFCLLMALVPFAIAGAGGHDTVVAIPDVSAEQGQEVTVPISINDVTGMGAIDICLHYDSSVVEVTDVADGDLPYSLFLTDIDNPAGETRIMYISLAPGGDTGTFVLATVTLHAVGSAGETSPLELEVIDLVDTAGAPVSHSVDDGLFNIALPFQHEPMAGKKLVGTGYVGYFEIPSSQYAQIRNTQFLITNPDCEQDITIERLSIIKFDFIPDDDDPLQCEVIYEGPLQWVVYAHDETDRTLESNEVIARYNVTTLAPHQQVQINLFDWIPDAEGGFLTRDEAMNQFRASYTVEVHYTSEKGLDLIGRGETQCTAWYIWNFPETINQFWHYTPMVNMEQEVKEKEK